MTGHVAERSHTGHMSATIPYIRERLREWERDGKVQDYVTRAGQPVSYADAYAHLDSLEAEGVRFVTGCDSENPDGSCAGHTS